MTEYTPNLNLKVLEQDEQYNVDDYNENFDKIDDFAGVTPPKALTADKLTNGAKINGVNFKGDTDIITGLGLYSDTSTYNNTNLAYLYDNSKLRIFQSSQNGNIGHNPLTSPTYWNEIYLGSKRHFGEIVTSSLPITDEKLHLADGSVLTYSEYSDLITYMNRNYLSTNVTYYAWRNNETGRVYWTESSTPDTGDIAYTYNNTYEIVSPVGKVLDPYQERSISIRVEEGLSIYVRYSNQDKVITKSLTEGMTTENEWQYYYNTYGECGKYVLDVQNSTLRLPLYNSYFTNTAIPNSVGDFTPASIPNIKGEGILQDDASFCSGAIYKIGTVTSDNSQPAGNSSFNIGIDARKSSNIYSNLTTTLNTQSVKQLIYIVVKE